MQKIYTQEKAGSEEKRSEGDPPPRRRVLAPCPTDLTDHEVDLVRDLFELEGWSNEAIAEKFDQSVHVIRQITRYSRR